MALRIIWESVQFAKVKAKAWVQTLFLVLFIARAAFLLVPFGDKNFDFIQDLLRLSQGEAVTITGPTAGNWLVIGVFYGLQVFAFFVGAVYACNLIYENEDQLKSSTPANFGNLLVYLPRFKPAPQESLQDFQNRLQHEVRAVMQRKTTGTVRTNRERVSLALVSVGKKILPLLVILLLLALVLTLSSLFLFIPGVILISMLAFSPLNLTHGQHSLVRSFELSSSQTKQAKLNIFITFLLVNSLVLTGQNLLNLVVFENPVSYALLDSFFFAARCLIFARAWAILFITLGLRYPFVVQSEA